MSVHLQKQIEHLKQQITSLAARVEQALLRSVVVIERRDTKLAVAVIESDTQIDSMEVEIEEACLNTLALHQPVAYDLRYIIAVLKINNDLERIADMAVNIAEHGMFLASMPALDPPPFNVTGMADKVRRMLSRSLEAMINSDPEMADSVRKSDDEIDSMHRRMYELVEAAMLHNPNNIPQLLRYISLSRQLERIADLATNIAEDVIYTARGDILRHTGG